MKSVRDPLFTDSEKVRERVVKEVKIMARLNHENIVRYYDSWFGDWDPHFNSHVTPSMPAVGYSASSSLSLGPAVAEYANENLSTSKR